MPPTLTESILLHQTPSVAPSNPLSCSIAPDALHLRTLTSAQVSLTGIATFVTDFVLNNRHYLPALVLGNRRGSAMVRSQNWNQFTIIMCCTFTKTSFAHSFTLPVIPIWPVYLTLSPLLLLHLQNPQTLIPIWMAATSILTAAHLLHCERN